MSPCCSLTCCQPRGAISANFIPLLLPLVAIIVLSIYFDSHIGRSSPRRFWCVELECNVLLEVGFGLPAKIQVVLFVEWS
uniref:Uncharacterized protein n=1 Tax=Physcomitrium patens TaxID=3218 RepID=A0A2K1JBF3_PHYPA|nr:hypothetical protein PHYPA_019116 [Physcomitrium patens]